MFATCLNCSKSIRTANGMAFHASWCKPAAPVAETPETFLTRANAHHTVCIACGTRHDGAAWNVAIGWHDKAEAPVTVAERAAAFDKAPATRKAAAPKGHKFVAGPHYAGSWRKCPVCRDATPAPVGPMRKPAAAKAAKLPAVRSGKHARCVAHLPVTRTAPGVAYACFDVAPDVDAIAERQAFVASIDASWNAHHLAFEAARQTGDGCIAGSNGARIAPHAFKRDPLVSCGITTNPKPPKSYARPGYSTPLITANEWDYSGRNYSDGRMGMPDAA